MTYVDLSDDATPKLFSVRARHDIEPAGDSRVSLLSDRGWSSSGPDDAWAHMTVQDVADTARVVVGPDEPAQGESQENAESDHWHALENIASSQSVAVTADELRRLPHDVELTSRLRNRLRG